MEGALTTQIHRCSELPNSDALLQQDAQCLAFIEARYAIKPGTFKGHGRFGHVFQIYELETKISIAVKVLPFKHDADKNVGFGELRIACRLNKLKKYTATFQHTMGWLVCDSIPQNWLRMRGFDIQVPALYIFMQHMDFDFMSKELRFTKEELLVQYFTMIHGLYWARGYLHFVHADLHPGNMMFSLMGNPEQRWRVLSTQNHSWKVHYTLNVIPKFIDYGLSSTKCTPSSDAATKHDVAKMTSVFEQRAELDRIVGLFAVPVHPKVLQSTHKNTRALEQFLARYPPFQHMDEIERVEKPPKKIEACVFCGAAARVRYEGKRDAYCTSFCASAVRPLAPILP